MKYHNGKNKILVKSNRKNLQITDGRDKHNKDPLDPCLRQLLLREFPNKEKIGISINRMNNKNNNSNNNDNNNDNNNKGNEK